MTFFRLLILLVLFVWYSHAISSDLNLKSTEKIYSFGIVPQFGQRKTFRVWLPILKALEKRTGLKFILKGSAKIPVFEKNFIQGRFDFAYMNPFHILKAFNSQGYIPLVRDGGYSLRGIILVRKDSKIKNIEQLRNKMIALPSPNALGASLLIRSDLSNLFNVSVKPHYVQTHSSVYIHVAKGLYEAGGGVERTLNSQKISIKNKLKILYYTREIPPHPIAVHPRVSVNHQQLVLQALLNIAADDKDRLLYQEVPMNKVIAATIDDYKVLGEWGLDKYYVSN